MPRRALQSVGWGEGRTPTFALPLGIACGDVVFIRGFRAPTAGYFCFGKSTQNHVLRGPAFPLVGYAVMLGKSGGPGIRGLRPLRHPGPSPGFSCASRRDQVAGAGNVRMHWLQSGQRSEIDHRILGDGVRLCTLPSIAARRGGKRGVFEPPKAVSSRAPRRARSAGQRAGAGLLGTFRPSLNSPGGNLNG